MFAGADRRARVAQQTPESKGSDMYIGIGTLILVILLILLLT
jgi:hypothetical protein